MKTPEALLSWFNDQLNILPDYSHSIDRINELLEDPPAGITQVKFVYGSVQLHPSGPKGWTYFPADDDGSRLARISCSPKTRGPPVTIMVKLFKKAFTATDADTYTITENAILTIDNLSSHGCVEYRQTHPGFKRRKVTICK